MSPIAGEIDLLIADPGRRRIWVCEVKDIYTAASPETIQRRIAKFTHPRDGFVQRLLTRRDKIAENLAATLALLGVPAGAERWRVLPLMITRRVEPAAFVTGIGAPFVVVADLASTLSARDDPADGQIEIGAR